MCILQTINMKYFSYTYFSWTFTFMYIEWRQIKGDVKNEVTMPCTWCSKPRTHFFHGMQLSNSGLGISVFASQWIKINLFNDCLNWMSPYVVRFEHLWPCLQTEICLIHIGFKAWNSACIHVKLWDTITYSCCNFRGDFVKPHCSTD